MPFFIFIMFVVAEMIRADTCKAWCSALTFSHGRCGPTNRIPPGISKMQHVIFGNLLDLYEFHHNTFLKELEKYEHMPEEFGRCFVTWAVKFQFYVDYCKNHPRSSKLNMVLSQNYFD
ncbi:triple functional domain protein-like isoform X2 [Stigmatopora argus]